MYDTVSKILSSDEEVAVVKGDVVQKTGSSATIDKRKDVRIPNYSFFFMKEMLKKMGVKNNDFMLQLNDQDLRNIDPWNTKDDVERRKVLTEVKQNIWYFLRECVKVIPSGRSVEDAIPFELNIGTLFQIYLFTKKINSVLMTVRQIGQKTHLLIALEQWCLITGNEASHNPRQAVNLSAVHKLLIPEYLYKFPTIEKELVGVSEETYVFVDDIMHMNGDIPFYGVSDHVLVMNGTVGRWHRDLIQRDTIPFTPVYLDHEDALNIPKNLIFRITVPANKLSTGNMYPCDFDDRLYHLRKAMGSRVNIQNEIDIDTNPIFNLV